MRDDGESVSPVQCVDGRRMKLLKPAWVTHDGFPIFSLDVHPDGSRFATGGQGAGDSGRVVIWNMGPVIDEEQESKENIPKFLSRMDNHLNCVNCVRWSTDGKYLASGGDDKVIMIWQIARYNSSSAGNSLFGGSANAETWRCVATLRGHSGDILDLNWSKTEPWLASCSVDNSVIIWNTNKWNEIVTTLRGHTGLVKGVSFDPIGTYVASQSDDKSLKVWRTMDWEEECTLIEPFVECGGTTHVLRLNWSPDGQHLVSAHAMNNCGSVAQIIEREGWSAKRDYVGHRKAVTCVRFNPKLMRQNLRKKDKEKETTCHCLAVGSRDRSVSVWITCSERPLVVVHELFDKSVLDLSWSSCGRRLMACSWDGSVACIEFEKEELGIRLSDLEMTAHLEKLYGKSVKSSNAGHNLLAEDADFLKVREENLNNKSAKTNGHAAAMHEMDNRSMTDSRSSTSSRLIKGPTDKQIEVKMTNGKRRITPLYIPPPTDIEGIPIPFNSQATTFDTSAESKSRIPVEKRDSNLSPAKESCSAHAPDSSQPSSSQVAPKSDETAIAKPSQTPSQNERNRSDILIKKNATSIPKKKAAPNRPVVIAAQAPKSAPTGVSQPPSRKNDNRPDTRSRVSLTALRFEKILSVPIRGNEFKKHEIEAENKISNSMLHALRLKCLEPESKVWEVILANRITAVTSSTSQTAVACDDHSISVFSTHTGRRLHPPIVLDADPALLMNTDTFLLVITTDACLHLWDMVKRQSLLRKESLLPLFSDGKSIRSDLHIVNSVINDSGTPVITMSNKKSFAFDSGLRCWSLVADPSDLIAVCSDIRHPRDAKTDPSAFPLAQVQQMHRTVKSSHSVFQSNSGLQATATISLLDQQLAAAFILSSASEYKFWLLALVQALTDAGREERLRELCTFLLGPVFGTVDSWDSQILGLEKRDLLTEVLVVMTSNMRLQRLYSEMREQLNVIDGVSGTEPMATEPSAESSSPLSSDPLPASQSQTSAL